MLTSVERDWRDTMLRMMAERDDYKRKAAMFRKEATEKRRLRRWAEVLHCADRARYFSREAANRHSEAIKIKKQWGFK